MKPGLYRGRVIHHRYSPVVHRFEYAHSMWAFDLDDPQVSSCPPLLGIERLALATFRERDFLPDRERSPSAGPRPLAQEVRARVAAALGRVPDGRILLLAQPRVLGLQFNPASFFLCFDEQDDLQALLVEVRNTPWNERHCYVLDLSEATGDEGTSSSRRATAVRRQRCDKEFHVSPFLEMAYQYAWSVAVGERRIGLSIANERSAGASRGERDFVASLALEHQPATRWATLRALCRQPFGAIGVLARIHWQALLLTLRGVPFRAHPHNLSGRGGAPAEISR